jgi:hypothetical protein
MHMRGQDELLSGYSQTSYNIFIFDITPVGTRACAIPEHRSLRRVENIAQVGSHTLRPRH